VEGAAGGGAANNATRVITPAARTKKMAKGKRAAKGVRIQLGASAGSDAVFQGSSAFDKADPPAAAEKRKPSSGTDADYNALYAKFLASRPKAKPGPRHTKFSKQAAVPRDAAIPAKKRKAAKAGAAADPALERTDEDLDDSDVASTPIKREVKRKRVCHDE
jgi:hypothetical protein